MVAEPTLPASICTTLAATLSPANGSIDAADEPPASSAPDTARLQRAIDGCTAGQAVRLVRGAQGQSGFLSGPLTLKSGVTLWVDAGVTLFASRNPADFDNGGGPNAHRRSWWDVAWQNKSEGLKQQNPQLLRIEDGGDFTLYRITLLNSPQFHVVASHVAGLTAWGLCNLAPSAAYSVPGYACPPGSTSDARTRGSAPATTTWRSRRTGGLSRRTWPSSPANSITATACRSAARRIPA